MPSGCCRMRINICWFTGSARKLAFITSRALYRARSVRADKPLMPGVVSYSKKVSKIACGWSRYSVSLVTSSMPAFSAKRAFSGRALCVLGFSRSWILSSKIWLSCVTALAAQ